jgi:hypothetical protein
MEEPLGLDGRRGNDGNRIRHLDSGIEHLCLVQMFRQATGVLLVRS